MLINNQLIYISIFYLAINFVAFLIMLVDKNKASKLGAERISEAMLFFLATSFGALGVYLGMITLRHKTRKWYFMMGIPLLILQNIAFLYLLYLFTSNSYFLSI
jgi:uncharacterized membrane protein YsdA (DUF1294 family)